MQVTTFLDAYLFYIAFALSILGVIIIIQTNSKNYIIKNSAYFAYGFALLQFVLWAEFTFTSLANNHWYSILVKDLCPLISLISIPVFIAHRQIGYKMLMPWLLIGSTVTILGGGGKFTGGTIVGINNFLDHIIMLWQGIFAYFWVTKYNKKEKLQMMIFPFCLVLWNLASGLIPFYITSNEQWIWYSTGMFEQSYLGGFAILGEFNWPYPVATIVFYLLAVIGAFAIVENKTYFSFYWTKIQNQISKIWQKAKAPNQKNEA